MTDHQTCWSALAVFIFRVETLTFYSWKIKISKTELSKLVAKLVRLSPPRLCHTGSSFVLPTTFYLHNLRSTVYEFDLLFCQSALRIMSVAYGDDRIKKVQINGHNYYYHQYPVWSLPSGIVSTTRPPVRTDVSGRRRLDTVGTRLAPLVRMWIPVCLSVCLTVGRRNASSMNAIRPWSGGL